MMTSEEWNDKPTGDDLDALVQRLQKLGRDMDLHANEEWDEHEDVFAAVNAITDLRARCADHEAEIARLTAERDAAQAGAVKIKPLVWEKLGDRAWRAPSPFFGSFRVECYGGGPWQALWSVPGLCDTFVDGDFAGPDDAKNALLAAWRDFTARAGLMERIEE